MEHQTPVIIAYHCISQPRWKLWDVTRVRNYISVYPVSKRELWEMLSWERQQTTLTWYLIALRDKVNVPVYHHSDKYWLVIEIAIEKKRKKLC